jgi:hypothetical protein
MPVELERVGAGDRAGRRTGLVTALLPVAALCLVVAAALLGGRTPDAGPKANPLSPIANATPATPPSTRLTDGSSGDPGASGRSAALEASLPDYAFGLEMLSVGEAIERRAAGQGGDDITAISGYLSPDPRSPNCGESALVLDNAFCERRMVLASTPVPRVEQTGDGGLSTIADARWGSHLHVQALPGIPLPGLFDAGPKAAIGPVAPILVVVIGRFDDPRARPCVRPGRHCGEELVAERLAWADGGWVDRILAIHHDVPASRVAGEPVRARTIAVREADRGEAILSTAILPLAELASVDPAAAELAGATATTLTGWSPADRERPVWYLRSVGRPWPGEPRQLTWAVIDHASGLVLASGPQ